LDCFFKIVFLVFHFSLQRFYFTFTNKKINQSYVFISLIFSYTNDCLLFF
jgi:hypothetical protein